MSEEIIKKSAKAIEGLEPKKVFQFFHKLTTIPRKSKHEEQVVNWLEEWSKEKGFKSVRDKFNNIVISCPATKGYEKVTGIALQGHTDMVCDCVKGKKIDFLKDPIEIMKAGDWLTANGTTLGADNGMGVAIALAIFDSEKEFNHGPLEAVFTSDEETDMVGIQNFDINNMNSLYLINIDSEEEGSTFISCAGGVKTTISIPFKTAASSFKKTYQLEISGLKGGHSGCDIHIERMNGVKVLFSFLGQLKKASIPFSLSEADIGVPMYNAIPREGSIVFNCDLEKAKVEEIVNLVKNRVLSTYGSVDPNPQFDLKELDAPAKEQWDESLFTQVYNLIVSLPHGVQRMSKELKGICETSTNLANIKLFDGMIKIGNLTRSLISEEMWETAYQIRACCELAHVKYEQMETFQAWKPNVKSGLLAEAKSVYKEKFGKELDVQAIHAGLECGVFINLRPKMEAISIGLAIENPHTPEERVKISDVPKLYKFTKELIIGIAEKGKN